MNRKAFVIAWLFVVAFSARQPAVPQEPMKVSIINTERKEVGQVSITDAPNGVIVGLSLREKPAGVPPGVHGFHIHAVGKCEPQGPVWVRGHTRNLTSFSVGEYPIQCRFQETFVLTLSASFPAVFTLSITNPRHGATDWGGASFCSCKTTRA